MNEQHVGSELAAHDQTLLGESEEPPTTRRNLSAVVAQTDQDEHSPTAEMPGPLPATPVSKRHPFWRDIPEFQWQDWRWQRQNAVRTTAQLAALLPLDTAEIAALERLETQFRTAIPPYYFSLINVDDPNDPIRIQSCPSSQEEVNISGVEFEDPLEEDKDSPVPGITHRYPDRALLITTPVCSMYCRFCTRKRVTMDREGWDAPSRNEERMIQYIRETPAIRDVILSGGDPLTLPPAKLRWFLTELAAIEHVDMIRVGTRVPVTLPQRLFDPELIALLQSVEKVWIQTHFNHPAEITPEATLACRNLVNAGMPINNHAVLMRGVNDSVDIMRQLVCGLMKIKVRPYYLFHCDPVTGAGHFRTSIWKGIEIIEGLRGHVSGLAVPTYVVDGLHGAGKIPVMPNYMLSASDDAVVLRNYEGMIFRYAPEDKVSAQQPLVSTGVSKVLSAGGAPLVPADGPRQARRRKNSLERVTTEITAADELAMRASMPPPSSPKVATILPVADAAALAMATPVILPMVGSAGPTRQLSNTDNLTPMPGRSTGRAGAKSVARNGRSLDEAIASTAPVESADSVEAHPTPASAPRVRRTDGAASKYELLRRVAKPAVASQSAKRDKAE